MKKYKAKPMEVKDKYTIQVDGVKRKRKSSCKLLIDLVSGKMSQNSSGLDPYSLARIMQGVSEIESKKIYNTQTVIIN